jgi:drug/metabolite transporter (DMT)-like permease
MSWLFYALLSPLIFTIVNFIDKFILEHQVKDTRAMPVYAAIMAFITGCVLFVLTGFPTLPLNDTIIVMITGAMTSVGAALYFNALVRDEVSKIVVLIQMQPVIVLVLSLLFLNETISVQQLIGFMLILGAAVAISINREGGGFRLSTAFFLILVCDLLWAGSIVLFKFVSGENSFGALLPYESWGLALGGLGLYLFVPFIRRAFNQNIRTVSRRALALVAMNETIFVVAKLTTLAAIALGPVALVSVLGSTQVFFGVALGAILTRLAPTKFKEDISRRSLTRKAFFALVMFGGIILVSEIIPWDKLLNQK